MPQRGIDQGWRSPWTRLVDRVSESDPLTLYKAVEEGVPAATVAILSRALGEPAPGVLDIIGLAETTYRRKAEAGEALDCPLFRDEVQALIETLPQLPGRIILVSIEVGWGVVPMAAVSRLFADEQGRLNQRVAAVCERVTLVAGGLPLVLKPQPDNP